MYKLRKGIVGTVLYISMNEMSIVDILKKDSLC